MKIMTIVGTRPELIKLSSFIKHVDKFKNITNIFVHTGQNYDYELNEIFYTDLNLRKPDIYLDIDTSSLARVYSDVLIKTENLILNYRPDVIVILGDTNSSIAALIAKRMKVPVYHLEAGNRSYDSNVPEEINRKMIDHISDFNIVYSEHSYKNLMTEGINPRFVFKLGSPLKEVINEIRPLLKQFTPSNQYIIASFHREENVDNKENLIKIIDLLHLIAKNYEMKVKVTLHPRTAKKIKEFNIAINDKYIEMNKPYGFIEYCKLQMNAFMVISDSGTISEESAILGFKAITIRNSMERPEALDTGSIIITGFDVETVFNSIDILKQCKNTKIPEAYDVDDFSDKLLKIIVGTYKLRDTWYGINR